MFVSIPIEPLLPMLLSSPKNTVFMVSQKSLSHSSRMIYAAPSLRLFFLPSISRFLVGFLDKSAISLADVKAARGGLDGGDSH